MADNKYNDVHVGVVQTSALLNRVEGIKFGLLFTYPVHDSSNKCLGLFFLSITLLVAVNNLPWIVVSFFG